MDRPTGLPEHLHDVQAGCPQSKGAQGTGRKTRCASPAPCELQEVTTGSRLRGWLLYAGSLEALGGLVVSPHPPFTSAIPIHTENISLQKPVA